MLQRDSAFIHQSTGRYYLKFEDSQLSSVEEHLSGVSLLLDSDMQHGHGNVALT
jgi:hypothetical protein